MAASEECFGFVWFCIFFCLLVGLGLFCFVLVLLCFFFLIHCRTQKGLTLGHKLKSFPPNC